MVVKSQRLKGRSFGLPLALRRFHTGATLAAFVSVLVIAPALWMLMDRTPPYELLAGIPATRSPAAG